jgi:hypothetical protein
MRTFDANPASRRLISRPPVPPILDRTPYDLSKAGRPDHVFSLRKAFDDLQKGENY